MFKENLRCYVSNLDNNTIYIADIEKNNIFKSIELPFKPLSLAAFNNCRIYVGSDKKGIAIISTIDNEVKIKNISNNGNIVLDDVNKRMYISDISRVLIYDMDGDTRLGEIKGFKIVDNLQVDKKGERLFILDLFTRELKIYDTVTLKLISNIKNVGVKPNFLIIDEDNGKCYIANKGDVYGNSGNVSVIDISDNSIIHIDLPINSSITYLALKNNFLYACNIGLNRIEVIDIRTNKRVKHISKDYFNPQSIFLTTNKEKFIIINKKTNGNGEMCIVDTLSNSITSTIPICSDNIIPYGIAFIFNNTKEEKHKNNEVEQIVEMCEEEKVSISVKKIFNNYEEKIHFEKVIADIPNDYIGRFVLEDIKFSRGFIVHGTEEITPTIDKINFFKVNFLLKIPYMIKFKDDKNESIIIKKFIERHMELILDIPIGNEKNYTELCVNTKVAIINAPVIIKDILSFSVEALVDLKVMGEMELSIPTSAIEKYFK